MNPIEINDKISYIKASNNPLSADIGIIKSKGSIFLFDVGNGIDNIKSLVDTYDVVISHFHLDHIGNIKNLKINNLYVSKETYKHLPKEVIENTKVTIVEDEIKLNDLRIFTISSSHSKGSLCLEIDDTYTFIGDATYCKFKNNKLTYNSQLLKEEIDTLKSLKSKYLLVSHFNGLIRDKNEVIEELEEIYSLRTKNSPEITVIKE